MTSRLHAVVRALRGVPASVSMHPPMRGSRAIEARRLLQQQTRLHLGCGPNVLAGWSNVDLGGQPPVVAWDLTHPLPCDSNVFSFIYSEHFIEHIALPHAKALIADCYRMLMPGGVLRISTPSLEALVEAYQDRRLNDWSDVGWTADSSCQLLNEGMRSWGHQFLFDREELVRTLSDAGFETVVDAEWGKSSHAPLCGLECRPFHNELIVEASK